MMRFSGLFLGLAVLCVACGGESPVENPAPGGLDAAPEDVVTPDVVLDAGTDAEADVAETSSPLSPANWPEGELETYSEHNATFDRSQPSVTGKAMISGTSNALAVRCGFEALNRGGTAADAAVATALAQVVLAAGSYVSAAGIFLATYYDASDGTLHYLNAGFNTPLHEDSPLTIPASSPSGRTALVPGFPAGIGALHARFGALPFADVMAPAIYFAEEGFELNYLLGYQILAKKTVLGRRPETRAIFTKESGAWYETGDWFRQPVLAQTLRSVAQQGSAYFYEGPWAQHFVDAVQQEGGTITLEDLAAYEVMWSTPATTTHRGYTVNAPALPSLGGVNVIEALNVFEAADLASMGAPTQSAEALYWFAQIQRLFALSYFDDEALATMIPGIDMSPQSRLTKPTASQLWDLLRTEGIYFAGPPETPNHSDAIVVVDPLGNIAAITHTINTTMWGGTGIFVDGVSVPDAASFQQQRIAQTGPGQRLPEETNPTIVIRDGQPVIVASTIGMVHQRLLSALYPMLTYDTPIVQASAWQGVLFPDFTVFNQKGIIERVLQGEYETGLLDQVRAMGMKIEEIPEVDHHAYRGYWVGLQRSPDADTWEGVTSMYLNGAVIGH